jgi:hypothetical protein
MTLEVPKSNKNLNPSTRKKVLIVEDNDLNGLFNDLLVAWVWYVQTRMASKPHARPTTSSRSDLMDIRLPENIRSSSAQWIKRTTICV